MESSDRWKLFSFIVSVVHFRNRDKNIVGAPTDDRVNGKVLSRSAAGIVAARVSVGGIAASKSLSRARYFDDALREAGSKYGSSRYCTESGTLGLIRSFNCDTRTIHKRSKCLLWPYVRLEFRRRREVL